MDESALNRLREITQKFPKGCKVQRKKDVKLNQNNLVEKAIVEDVVMTGIFSTIYLKTDDFSSLYLDPDDYEIVENNP